MPAFTSVIILLFVFFFFLFFLIFFGRGRRNLCRPVRLCDACRFWMPRWIECPTLPPVRPRKFESRVGWKGKTVWDGVSSTTPVNMSFRLSLHYRGRDIGLFRDFRASGIWFLFLSSSYLVISCFLHVASEEKKDSDHTDIQIPESKASSLCHSKAALEYLRDECCLFLFFIGSVLWFDLFWKLFTISFRFFFFSSNRFVLIGCNKTGNTRRRSVATPFLFLLPLSTTPTALDCLVV